MGDNARHGDEEPRTTSTTTTKRRTTRTTSAPMRISKDSMEAIEGNWVRDTDPGRFIERINDGMIHWDVGPVTKMHALGNAEFSTVWQGSTYHARLLNGQLV